MPATDRGPEPRPRPSSTVSAWSSSVCPSATRAPTRTAASASASKRAARAAPSGPPAPATSTRSTRTGWSPRPRSSCAVPAARSAEPGCRPWATVTPPTATAADRASKASAAASATESAPPLQAASTGCSLRRRPLRTAERSTATARGGPTTAASGGDGRAAVHPLDPARRVGELLDPRQGLRPRPHAVEALHADEVDHAADEVPTVGVLLHLLLQAEKPAQHAIERAAALATLGEPLAQGLHRRDDVRADAVHHVLGVPLDQAHHRGDAIEDGALRGVLDEGHQPAVVAVPAAHGVTDAAQHVPQPLAQHVGVEVRGIDELGDLGLEVALEPRHGGELQLVGHLVQADPQPEVAGVDAETSL